MSGSTIGGVLGGAIGFFAGFGWGGARVGFMIGSAVGGYVDPVRTQGPRLEDASAQTSNDGVPIPFGYGVFTCAGNVIWSDKLIEHKHTERVGKGGGSQKQTTYTYTRSYAIGICEGQIHGLLWVKKNGKLVYSSNPAQLGAMMHWNAQQIADLVASSNEFLKETTIYYGSESQMPDSTIVAVEGMGNVSAHRGLAYIVIENEDLTNTGGAISQHEFCVQGTPPEAYLTSKPYDQFWEDTAYIAATPQFVLRDLMAAADLQPDAIEQGVTPVGGALISIYKNALTEDDHIQHGVTPVGGSLLLAIQYAELQADAIQQGVTAVGGRLVDIPLGKQEPDAIQQGVTPVGGQLY